MISFFRYVRHAAIADYEMHGWRVCADLGPTHGHWSTLMIFVGGGVGP